MKDLVLYSIYFKTGYYKVLEYFSLLSWMTLFQKVLIITLCNICIVISSRELRCQRVSRSWTEFCVGEGNGDSSSQHHLISIHMELSSCFILPASSDMSVLATKCPRVTQLPAVQPFNGSVPNNSGFFSLLVLTIFRDVQTSMEVGGSTWWMHSLTECIDGWKVIFKAQFKIIDVKN